MRMETETRPEQPASEQAEMGRRRRWDAGGGRLVAPVTRVRAHGARVKRLAGALVPQVLLDVLKP